MSSITIASTLLETPWRWSSSSPEVRVYANQLFVTSDNTEVLFGSPYIDGSPYASFTITLVGTAATIGSGSLDSTTDSLVPATGGATYSAFIFSNGILRDAFLPDFQLSASPTSTSWGAIFQYQPGPKIRLHTEDFYTKTQSDSRYLTNTLDSAKIFVGNSSNVATGVALSGDAAISNTGVLTLASVATPGTYRSITVDAKGRATAGTNPTTFSGYGLSDTSANLAAALTDETGPAASGIAVFGTVPTTWVPTFTNLSVGNGTLTAKYIQIGKLVTGHIVLVFGTTTSVSSDILFSLPVTRAAMGGTDSAAPLGQVRVFDVSAPIVFLGHVTNNSTTLAGVRFIDTSGTYAVQITASSIIPITWATSDELTINFTYEAA